MIQKSEIFRRTTLVLTVASLVFAMSCSSSKKKEDDGGVPTAPAADENATLGDSDSGKAMGLQTVQFPFDSFTLSEEAKGVLNSNATILQDKPNLRVQIEGHCDARGGIQYNIALGEKRANVAKKFLEDKGVSGERITIISFGKERPVDPASSEEAYARNRRDNFVITSH